MKSSSLLKTFAWRTFFQTIIFSILLFLAFGYFFWKTQAFIMPITILEYLALFAFLLLYGILRWFFQKNTLAKLLSRQSDRPALKKKVLQELRGADAQQPQQQPQRQRPSQNYEKRLFIHLFSVLQREGRLLDFLKEDLSPYDDTQIGAAVRSVHENCKKTMDRYLSPEPILEKAEGGTVNIPDGFDQNAIKLVGNVVGEPPFTGIVRHRGWKFKSASLPKLSEAGNPEIIAPAEVEIQ